MKKLTTLLLVSILLVLGLLSTGNSVTEQRIWITVSVSVPADVTVVNTATTNWSILNKPFSFVTNREIATIVSNSGSANEAFRLAVQNFGTLHVDGWTNSTTTANGVDIYVLQALFDTQGSEPATNDYVSDDVVTVNAQTATASVFANASRPTNAANVVPGGKRNLWLKFTLPSGGVANPVSPTCRLVISAEVK